MRQIELEGMPTFQRLLKYWWTNFCHAFHGAERVFHGALFLVAIVGTIWPHVFHDHETITLFVEKFSILILIAYLLWIPFCRHQEKEKELEQQKGNSDTAIAKLSDQLQLFKNAEQELKEIRRRGDAPFFVISNQRFNGLYLESGDGHIRHVSALYAGLLCELRNEAKLSDGEAVLCVLDNLGSGTRYVSTKLDDQIVLLKREPNLQGSSGLYYLEYPYVAAKHGKEQLLSITFETESGLQDTHLYVLRHGVRFLQRVDPSLP